MKYIIYAINALSSLAILAYPFTLLASVMMFDNQKEPKTLLTWLFILASFTYPALVVVSIYTSNRFHSLLLALIGLIPIIILAKILFFNQNTETKMIMNTKKPAFVCNNNQALFIEDSNKKVKDLTLIQKRFFVLYTRKVAGTIIDNTYLIRNEYYKKDASYENILSCKNEHGKDLRGSYTILTDEEYQKIREKN